jgi:hypothetical protein
VNAKVEWLERISRKDSNKIIKITFDNKPDYTRRKGRPILR